MEIKVMPALQPPDTIQLKAATGWVGLGDHAAYDELESISAANRAHPDVLQLRCPSEDCGGSPGYADFVDAMADPKHERHEEMKEWVGGAWDATRFCLEYTNAGLNRIKA